MKIGDVIRIKKTNQKATIDSFHITPKTNIRVALVCWFENCTPHKTFVAKDEIELVD